MATSLRSRSLLAISDFSPEELAHVIATARKLKGSKYPQTLKGKSIAMLFEKPSLRTRVSFDVAIQQLGGHALYLGSSEVGLGKRESIPDIAHTLSRLVEGIVARVFAHESLIELARYASVPVINALSDEEHPCQALADLVTIEEKKKKLKGARIAFVGDGNNVASSLALGACVLGAHFSIASPRAYQLPKSVRERADASARTSHGSFSQMIFPKKAIKNADVVCTDVWTSMGQEASRNERVSAFNSYTVTSKLMALAKRNAIFMHPLPAHRGEEVEDKIIDGPQSVVFAQAENRLHTQRALLHLVFGPR